MSHYKGQNRYQFQPWYVKLYRWLRWKPYWTVRSVIVFVLWVADGQRAAEFVDGGRMTREETAWAIWSERNLADFQMGHYWSIKECIEHLSVSNT